VLFPNSEDDNLLVSSQHVVREVKEGSQCFIILTQLSVEDEGENVETPVVRDFMDVFPKVVLGLPPKREVEFFIDLVLEVGLVSITPYRVAPAELIELKKQIEELLEK